MRNEILQGDVLEMLATLSAESVNCIITSPPYFGLRDYGLPPTHWPEVSYAPMAGLPEITIPPMACCLGLEDTIEAYVGHMVLVWRGLWRVLRGDGVGWLNLGDSYATGTKASRQTSTGLLKNHTAQDISRIGTSDGLKTKDLIGIPWRCAFALQADGWYLRSDVIWAKKNPMPESVRDRPTKAHEYLFLLAKSERYWWDQEAIREDHKKPWDKTNSNRGNYSNGTTTGYDIKTGSRQKFSCAGLTQQVSGRNKRTVWSIATKPFPGAHFAVMPEALVEPCLLAGCPAQVCAECGEPWVRVVERETIGVPRCNEKTVGQNHHHSDKHALRATERHTKTIAHAPTCAHSAPTRPGIALDPFLGSGTVGVVATKFKRYWVGIELNPDYAEMARKRLNQTQPALFV